MCMKRDLACKLPKACHDVILQLGTGSAGKGIQALGVGIEWLKFACAQVPCDFVGPHQPEFCSGLLHGDYQGRPMSA